MASGNLLSLAIRSNTRRTRFPPSDVSTPIAGHSRVPSSTMVNIRIDIPVPDHVGRSGAALGIHLLLNPGLEGGIPANVAQRHGIDGPLGAVPAIPGKQADTGSFAQPSPVGAEFFEQDRAEHHRPGQFSDVRVRENPWVLRLVK
jgi:hypothetical protein